jgi:uncharacterized protein YggE
VRNSIVGFDVTMNRRVRAVALLVVAVAAPAAVRAQAPVPGPTPRVVVSGTGEARVSPDRATIFVGVQSRATTAAAAGTDNARRQKAILDTLKALGLSSDQLSTMNYNVSPEMNYNQTIGAAPKVTGYVVTNTVRADVRRIEDVGKLIDAVLGKGANEISSLQFFSSKADSARRSAMAEAVKNARADAESLARASGGSLGGVIEISTTSSPVRPFAEMAMAKVAAAPQTPIEPGQQTISATVTVTYRLVER